MKFAFIGTVALVVWILVFGSPLAPELPDVDYRYNSPEPILPMTFAHLDHTSVGCIDCHHNYVDDTGGEPCMICHVTNADVWPLLEEQFHGFCRGCHEDLAATNDDGGPPRQCMGCHLAEELP